MSGFTVKLPDVGEGVAQAEIVEWHVAVGDTVDEDDVLVEVMSDKATIELPSPVTGTVLAVNGAVGDVIAVGSELVVIDTGVDDAGAPDVAPLRGWATPDPGEALAVPPTDPAPSADPAPAAAPRPRAAPAVRARARDLGVDLATITGSGPDGRITHRDLDALLRRDTTTGRTTARVAAAEGAGPTDVAIHGEFDGEVDEVRVIGLRRNIAERMQASKRRIPHFTYVEEVDVTDLERLRRELNDARSATRPRLSLLPLLMRAVVVAVRSHPGMNARFDDDEGVVRRHRSVHLGIATQTDRGLMVPVVRSAQSLDPWESAAEVARLAESARSGKISLADLNGSTITITSLGALGGVVTTPVINAPEVAIIGVNKIVDRPVYAGEALVRRQLMNLSSSFDHRVVDGADAAAFVQEIKRLVETPALLFVDVP